MTMSIGELALGGPGAGLSEMMVWGGVRVAAVLVVLLGLTLALRVASAATRHTAWRAGFAVALMLPVAAPVLPWRLPVLPASSIERGATIDGGVAAPATMSPSFRPLGERSGVDDRLADRAATKGREGTGVGGVPAMAASDPETPATSGLTSTLATRALEPALVLLAVWLAGVLALGARLLVGHAAVRGIVRRGVRLTAGDWTGLLYEAADVLDVAVDVDLVASDRVAMPFTAGVRRPVIVLPTSAEAWAPSRRRAVLMHELAHIQRRDLFSHHLARWVCVLHWFNPLAWMGARRMRADSERAADDLVLRAGTRASEYADHLLQIVSNAGRGRMPAPALPLAQRREFEGRMLAILDPALRQRVPGRLQTAAVSALVLLLALPLAALEPERARQEAAPVMDAADAAEAAEAADAASAAAAALNSNGSAAEPDASTTDANANANANVDSNTNSNSNSNIEFDPPAGASHTDIDPDLVRRHEPQPAVPVPLITDGARHAAAEIIASIDDPRAVEALIRILREDTDPEVRAAAAWALGEIEDDAAVAQLSISVREDASAEVRKNAAWALGQIEHEGAVEALGEALHDEDVEVRRTAMWALGQIESPTAVPALIRALTSEDEEVRRTAAWALGEIEDESAVDGLVAALRGEDAELRRTAAWALGQIESPRAVSGLLVAVRDEVSEVRRAAVQALADIEVPAAAPGLVRALADDAHEVRTSAAYALGEIDLQVAPPELIAALRDAHREVRLAAAHALGEICDPAAVDGLKQAMSDADEHVRMAAVHALVEMDTDVAYDALVEMLNNEDPRIRREAVRALGNN